MRNELIPRDVGITRPGVFCRLGKEEIQEDRMFNIKDNIRSIEEKLNIGYEFKSISKDKWLKNYKPILEELLSLSEINKKEYKKAIKCLTFLKKDLIKKEDILQTKNVTQTVSQLETFIIDDRKEYWQNHYQKVRLFKNQ